MQSSQMPYQKQIFVCTHQSDEGKPCCGNHGGEIIFHSLRNIAKERGLHPRIRVAQAKCLGQCAKGANIMVDGVWHSQVREDDIPQLAEKYLS